MESGKWVWVNGRLFGSVAPMVLISVGYIDPGKWTSCIDSGARFGGDLMPFLLVFNFVAVLFHYLSARIAAFTGRSLAQICCKEYDKLTCIFLGVQAELSAICLELTTILGIAHGLKMIFGADLFTGSLLSALNVVLYPLFSALLDSSKVKFLVVCMAGLMLVCYVVGMLISLPEFPVSSNGMLLKPSGESAFALMSLLGANVMPHNFYLYSSIVKQCYRAPATASNRVWSHDNIMVTLIIFSGIVLANCVLMYSGANAFYSDDLGLATFQESMSLLDQAYRNRIIPFASFLILFFANQITALSWEFCAEGGEMVLQEFFSMDLPEWLHRATIRIFAVVPVICCLWLSGVEGIYHMLICTQVMVALLLPSSVIPLFRVVSSRPIMGQLKISPILEFVVFLTFMGMLGVEIIFVVEMIFGESDWVGNLRWNVGKTTSFAYVLLLSTAFVSLSFMFWLGAIPLKCVSVITESKKWDWDAQHVAPKSYIEMKRNDVLETRNYEEQFPDKQESLPSPEKTFSIHVAIATRNYDINLPDAIMDSIQELSMTSEESSAALNLSAVSSRCHHDPKQSIAPVKLVPVSSVVSGASDQSLSPKPMISEESNSVEKTLRIEGDTSLDKDDEDGDTTWEPEDSSKDVAGVGTFATPEGPGSFRSLSGKSDEGGTSTGSLSRLSGLGRAARRQLAAALDEFWGQLYDFHGQITQEAKVKKLDQLFGLDSKPSQYLSKIDSVGKKFGMQFQSLGDRVSDNSMNFSLYDAPSQQKLQSDIELACRAQRGSASIWSYNMQLLETYAQSSNHSTLDAGERRYQSLRRPPSSEGVEYQPATIHGYQFASYLKRMAKGRFDYANGQLESVPQKSTSMVPNNYQDSLQKSSSLVPSSYPEPLQKSSSFVPNNYQEPLQKSASLGPNKYREPLQKSGSLVYSYREPLQKPASLIPNNYQDSLAFALGQKSADGLTYVQPSSFQNLAVQGNSMLQSDKPRYDVSSAGPVVNIANQNDTKKYHSLPAISGLSLPFRNQHLSDRSTQWDSPNSPMGFGTSVGWATCEPTYSSSGSRAVAPLAFDELSPSRAYSLKLSSGFDTGSLWSKQPFEQFGVANKIIKPGAGEAGSKPNLLVQECVSLAETESKLLQSLRLCILKLLKLEGSEWLFRSSDGVDEDLIDRVATRERFLNEVESRDLNQGAHLGESQYSLSERKPGTSLKGDEAASTKLVSSVPQCGDGCVWKVDLMLSFGVWSIHRILELSLMESRPELWGKYTYVLNRLQGVIDLVFFKPRTPMSPCFCLQIPASYQMKCSPHVGNGLLPPMARPARGKVTTAVMLLDMIKDVETAISCRKGRSGTAAGDVAFPKGKENLASVLKRYKRRLSNKPVGTHDNGPGSRKLQSLSSYVS